MYYAGIDVGGSFLKIGLVDENLKLICKTSIPTLVGRSDREIIKDMADNVTGLAKQNGIDPAEIAGVGIGIPGVAKNGVVVALHNLYWTNVSLADIFREFFDVPVLIDNDANVAAIYEYRLGALCGCKVGVLLTLGTGVGGGIIINGKPFSGGHGLGGELGHLAIVPYGRQCTCGNKGCLEVYASATAVKREGRRCVIDMPNSLICIEAGDDYRNVTSKMVFDCAEKGDCIAEAIVDEYVDYLVMGITSIMNSLDPEIIALGGGVSAAGDYLLKKVAAAAEGKGVFEGQHYAEIKIAKSGNDAGLIGAAMLAIF